jgi:hypothetical protein
MRPTICAFVLALAGVAAAQVDCSNPDNLCTGDPCVIPSVEPENPCVVDFGARAVVIQGLRNVVQLDFTARSFDVQGSVGGSVGNGGGFALAASEGIVVDGNLTFKGGQFSAGPGDSVIRLVAGQGIDLQGAVRLIESPFAGADAAEEFRLEAGGDVTIGSVIYDLEGAGAVTINAGGRVDVEGSIVSRQTSFVGIFAPLVIDAGTDVVVDGLISFVDGDVTIQAGGTIEVRKPLKTRGPAIVLDAQNGVTATAPIRSVGRGGNSLSCGGVSILGHAGAVSLSKPLLCTGHSLGLGITVAADGDVTMSSVVKSTADTAAGGPIAVSSTAGDVTISGKLDSRGATGGDVQVSGDTVQVNVSRVDSRGRSGPAGDQHYTTDAGDLVLAGTFTAEPAGTIEGSASGNLTADGTFRVGDGGCIALSAGGTVSTGGSSFDQTVIADCP